MTATIGIVTGSATAQQFPDVGMLTCVKFKPAIHSTTYFLIGTSAAACNYPVSNDGEMFPANYLSEFWYKLAPSWITGSSQTYYLHYWGA